MYEQRCKTLSQERTRCVRYDGPLTLDEDRKVESKVESVHYSFIWGEGTVECSRCLSAVQSQVDYGIPEPASPLLP